MGSTATSYDDRYLAGILFFNRRDFFEAHEAWESIWLECAGPERRFYQALIQAAVALYHFGNGNHRGAAKLYRTSRGYMEPYGPQYLGLDTVAFWRQMEQCFAGVREDATTDRALRPAEEAIPTIVLDPAPEQWPDPEQFVEPDE